MSFDKIIALLRSDTGSAERRLTFQSGLAATSTPVSPRDGVPVHDRADPNCSTGGSTQPTTPPPEFLPRPCNGDAGGLGGRGMEWVMGFTGNERGGEAGVSIEEDGVSTGDGMCRDVADVLGENERRGDGCDAADATTADGVTSRRPAGGAAEACGSEIALRGAGLRSHGVAQFFAEGGSIESPAPGAGGGSVGFGQGLDSAAIASGASLPLDLAPAIRQVSAGATETSATQEAIVSDGDNSDRSRTLFTSEVGSQSVGSVSQSRAESPRCVATNEHRQREPPDAPSEEAPPHSDPGDGNFGRVATQVPTIAAAFLGDPVEEETDRFRGEIKRGSLSAADQSLDTVSLLSEPAIYAEDPPKPRVWLVSKLWGGGGAAVGSGGGGGGGGSGTTPTQGSEEGEVEGARRLARSLAAKLKDRTRRCEELEDLFGLRDDQVSMLQRQSNSLVARVAYLADELSDKSSLVDALQRDRARLERELAESRAVQECEEGHSGLGDGPAGPVARATTGGDVLPRTNGSTVSADALSEDGKASEVEEEAAASAAVAAAAEAESLSAALEAAESKSRAEVAAAEARCLALTEMVDNLVANKVQWEEERAASAASSMRLRARVRGLEEAIVDRDTGGGDGEVEGAREKLLVQGLRKLLGERTRELEERNVAMARLASRVRESEEENRRLNVSLLARGEDLLASDREMHALSSSLKRKLRESSEATAVAEAAAGELRRALEAKGEGVPSGEEACSAGGGVDRPVADKVERAEERARLHHNLLSLNKALEEREARAAADETAASLKLKIARDDCDRLTQEATSLREVSDSLRVELASALSAAAKRWNGCRAVAVESETEVSPRSGPAAAIEEEVSAGGDAAGVVEEPVADQTDRACHPEGTDMLKGGEGAVACRVAEEGETDTVTGVLRAEGGCGLIAVVDGRSGDADASPGAAKTHINGSTSGVSRRDAWLDGGADGGTDDLQLEVMEKDILIEQLRAQLKQLRSRIAEMENEQAADMAPLQGLLNQLGELKGSAREREEREQHCRDQVDLGLMRMERLKEETAAATATGVASPPTSFAGSTGVSPPFLVQGEPPYAQVEHQRLRRQIEDLQWDLRTATRRVEERDAQLRDARHEADALKKRCRDAERELGAAQNESAMAATEAATERRKAGARRTELQSLRAELQSVRDRAASAAEEQRLRLGADVRDRVSAAVAAAETEAKGRVATLTESLRMVTAERDELVERQGSRERRSSGPEEDSAARVREVEKMRFALAARDAELDAVVDATAEFVHRAESLAGAGVKGGGGFALRGALAATTEARRAGRLVLELREESSLLSAKVAEGRADISRLREALEESKVGEKKTASAAAAAAATAAAAAAASAAREHSRNSPQGDAKADRGGHSPDEVEAADKRARAAEDALLKALAGAERAWRAVSSCLLDKSVTEDDIFGANVSLPPAPLSWQPASDPGLNTLVAGTEALASAYRMREHALRRATVAARAKAVCAREARRREAAEARAREDAEGRLEDALAALEDCRRHRKTRWGSGGERPVEREGGGRGQSFLSREQEEHLRQMRSEVDRLEGQNRTLRRSLVGGAQLLERKSGSRPEGHIPTQRLLFPQVVSTTEKVRSDAEWEDAEGMGGSDPASAGSPSSARSWAAASKVYEIPWRDGGRDEERKECGDARARVLEECAVYSVPPQDNGSGGTLVSGWVTDA